MTCLKPQAPFPLVFPEKNMNIISVKVYNISSETTPSDLRAFFQDQGYALQDVYIPKDSMLQKNRGFGFVRFLDSKEASEAIVSMEGRMLNGKEIRLEFANDRPPRSTEKDTLPRTSYQQEPQIKKLEEVIRLNVLEKQSLVSKIQNLEQKFYAMKQQRDSKQQELDSLLSAHSAFIETNDVEVKTLKDRNKKLSKELSQLETKLNDFAKQARVSGTVDKRDASVQSDRREGQRGLTMFDGAGESKNNGRIVHHSMNDSNALTMSPDRSFGAVWNTLKDLLKEIEQIKLKIEELENQKRRKGQLVSTEEGNLAPEVCLKAYADQLLLNFQHECASMMKHNSEKYNSLKKSLQRQVLDMEASIWRCKLYSLEKDFNRNSVLQRSFEEAKSCFTSQKDFIQEKLWALESAQKKNQKNRVYKICGGNEIEPAIGVISHLSHENNCLPTRSSTHGKVDVAVHVGVSSNTATSVAPTEPAY